MSYPFRNDAYLTKLTSARNLNGRKVLALQELPNGRWKCQPEGWEHDKPFLCVKPENLDRLPGPDTSGRTGAALERDGFYRQMRARSGEPVPQPEPRFLTDEEKAEILALGTPNEAPRCAWNELTKRIKAAHGGVYPDDWHRMVNLGGLWRPVTDADVAADEARVEAAGAAIADQLSVRDSSQRPVPSVTRSEEYLKSAYYNPNCLAERFFDAVDKMAAGVDPKEEPAVQTAAARLAAQIAEKPPPSPPCSPPESEDEGEDARADPRAVERYVRTSLQNEKVLDVFKEGMRIEQAEAAARADPPVTPRDVTMKVLDVACRGPEKVVSGILIADPVADRENAEEPLCDDPAPKLFSAFAVKRFAGAAAERVADFVGKLFGGCAGKPNTPRPLTVRTFGSYDGETGLAAWNGPPKSNTLGAHSRWTHMVQPIEIHLLLGIGGRAGLVNSVKIDIGPWPHPEQLAEFLAYEDLKRISHGFCNQSPVKTMHILIENAHTYETAARALKKLLKVDISFVQKLTSKLAFGKL